MSVIGSPHISFRLATSVDIPGIASVQHETTLETTWDRLRFGSINPQVWYDYLKEGLSESLLHAKHPSIITVAIDSNTTEIIGFVELEKLNSDASDNVQSERGGTDPTEQQVERPPRTRPEGFNLDAIMAYHGKMITVREKTVGKKPYIHVADLAVKGAYRRRGIATRLMRTAMDYARQEGQMLYFEATPSGVPLYGKLGFESIESFKVDLEPYGEKVKYREVAMLWKPESISNTNESCENTVSDEPK